jgi:putative ATP-binding cassette transporter
VTGAEAMQIPSEAMARHASNGDANWTELAFEDVSYAYPVRGDDPPFSVGPVSLVIRPGQVTFIVGGNGSGKSTLTKLLAGLYRPQRGEIFLDNKQITGDNIDWYRQHFSAVFEDYCLFDDLRGLGIEDDADLRQRADQYFERLALMHKVRVIGSTFSTTALSQGERKRLALITAYLEDRPIYLFDEWAAEQDPTFKRIFYTQLLPELKRLGKAVVVVSHDDRYFKYADQTLKLEDGKLVGEDTEAFLVKLRWGRETPSAG